MGDGHLTEDRHKRAMNRAAHAILESQREDGVIPMAPAVQASNRLMTSPFGNAQEAIRSHAPVVSR